MRLVQAVAVALALLAASPGAAQEPNGSDEILAQMPKELGGAPLQKAPEGILMYFLKGPSGEPVVVGVMVDKKDGVFPLEQMRSFARKSTSSRSGIRKIIREGSFATPRWPGAATFFGDYETSEFSHQHWVVMTGKHVITVLATYDKKKDAKWSEALVADKIFGGAVIAAGKDKRK